MPPLSHLISRDAAWAWGFFRPPAVIPIPKLRLESLKHRVL